MPEESPHTSCDRELLEYLCNDCRSAFDSDRDACPNCDARRPDEGWRRVRDYPDAWLGRTVGERYRLLQRMGEGTFGAVYRASRPHLDDTYAVKIIRLDDAEVEDNGRTLRQRVEREVQILSSISSPHIVNFHDYVELVGGAVGVIMDFVRGETLRQRLDGEHRLDRSLAVQFAIEIATGLREVHERGVVHRDLKPDNVMIQSLGRRREFIELIDFGVARFENDVRKTVGFVGTPRYTSPEQAQGEDTDERSDIYNLGMLLFHMLTGRPPFTSDNVNELLKAHSSSEPPQIGDVAPDLDIPEPLESLSHSMLEKDPDDRPVDMDDVLRGLKTIRSELETSEPEPSDLDSNPEKRDSLPPSFSTDLDRSVGSGHDTDEHGFASEAESTGTNNFDHRPPSDVFTVADEGRIIYCDDDNVIRIRVPEGGGMTETELIELDKPVGSIACENPDWVLVGQENGAVLKFEVETKRVETLLRRPDLGSVTSVATDPAGERLVAGFDTGAVQIGPPGAPSSEWISLGDGETIVSVAIHRDGSCIAAARADATTDVYLPGRSRREPTTSVDHENVPESIDFSPDGYLVAVRQHDGTVRLFSALSGAHVSDSPRSVLQASRVFEDDFGVLD